MFLNLQQMTEVKRCSWLHQNFIPKWLSAPAPGLYTCMQSWKNVYKISLQGDCFKLVANDRSDQRFLLTSKFCPLGVSDLQLYTFIKSWKDLQKVRGWRDFFLNLQQMTKVIRLSSGHKTFSPNGLSAPAQGLCICIKSWKIVHKIRGQSYVLKHATSDQSEKTFHQNIAPKGCLLLRWGYIYMYDIKQNMRQKGSI